MGKTQILIVDDNKMVRDGLKTLLELEDDFSVVGDAENGLQAIECAKVLKPDLVIMDQSMPGVDGITAARVIKENQPDIIVAILSVYQAEDYQNEIGKTEIANWISKSSTPEQIVTAVRASINTSCERGSF